jgi:hypothetical protein
MISRAILRRRGETATTLSLAIAAMNGWRDVDSEVPFPPKDEPVERMRSQEVAERLRISVQALATHLAGAGIHPRPMRFRHQVRRGYSASELRAAQKRFLADPLSRAASFYGSGPHPESPQDHREWRIYCCEKYPGEYGALNWAKREQIEAECRALAGKPVHAPQPVVTA